MAVNRACRGAIAIGIAVLIGAGNPGGAAAKGANMPTVVKLTQVGCQFVESENGVDHGFKTMRKADCDRINARTGAERAAALNHEPVNDAVEGQAVVELTSGRLTGVRIDVLLRAAGQTDEIVDSLGSLIGKEVNDDVAVIGAQSRGRGHLPAFL